MQKQKSQLSHSKKKSASKPRFTRNEASASKEPRAQFSHRKPKRDSKLFFDEVIKKQNRKKLLMNKKEKAEQNPFNVIVEQNMRSPKIVSKKSRSKDRSSVKKSVRSIPIHGINRDLKQSVMASSSFKML